MAVDQELLAEMMKESEELNQRKLLEVEQDKVYEARIQAAWDNGQILQHIRSQETSSEPTQDKLSPQDEADLEAAFKSGDDKAITALLVRLHTPED